MEQMQKDSGLIYVITFHYLHHSVKNQNINIQSCQLGQTGRHCAFIALWEDQVLSIEDVVLLVHWVRDLRYTVLL